MTVDDVRAVLAVVMSYDNRKLPGKANIAAWWEAAERGRWSFEDAVEAVHRHFATETEWIMPGHVTAGVRTIRQDRAMRELPPPPVIDPARSREVRELLAGSRLADDAPVAAPSGPDARLARACSYCAARPGEPCTRTSRAGRVPLAEVHPSRTEET